MKEEVDKFEPSGDKDSRGSDLLAKIIFTVIVGSFELVFSLRMISVFGINWATILVVVGFAFIMTTIWYDKLYVYRYLLPGIIIIVVMLAYPLLYTCYIAFTNYGTGHMWTKERAKEMILSSKWTVDYNFPILYGEFYAPESAVQKYMVQYEKLENRLRDETNKKKISEDLTDIEAEEYYENQLYIEEESLDKRFFGTLNPNEFSIFLYNAREIDSEGYPVEEDEGYTYSSFFDEEEDSDELETTEIVEGEQIADIEEEDTEEEEREKAKVYLSTYNKTTQSFDLEEISFEKVEELTKGKLLIEDYVYDRESLTEEKKADSYLVYLRKFSQLNNSLELEPMSDGQSSYLIEQSNEFYNKKRTYIESPDNPEMLLKIAEQPDGSLDYTDKVYPDDKGGDYVMTTDNEPVHYWKEYRLSGFPEYDMGAFALKKNFDAIDYLNEKLDEQGYLEKIDLSSENLLYGTPISELSKSDLDKVKSDIEEANKFIAEFNKQHSSFKKDYLANVKPGDRAVFPKLEKIRLVKEKMANIDSSFSVSPGYYVSVGFNNFFSIVTDEKITTPFLRVFVWTVAWAFLSVLSSFFGGLMLALALNATDFKGKLIYRTVFILPYAIPGFITVLMWRAFLNTDFGIVNGMIKDFFYSANPQDFSPIEWLNEPSGYLPKLSVLLVNLWLSFPYFMIISLGALQSIDPFMYEAAEVDGANKVQQFWKITLPLLLISLGPMLVAAFAFSFNNFAGIYLLTGGGPVMEAGVVPQHTDILISYTYKLAFGDQNKQYGFASAIAIIVFAIIGTITFLNLKWTGTFKEVDNG